MPTPVGSLKDFENLAMTFSMSRNNIYGDRWMLRIEDQDSSMIVVQVELSPEQFSSLMSSAFVTGVSGQVNTNENLGDVRSVVTFRIPKTKKYGKEYLREIAPQLKAVQKANPEWIVNTPTEFNQHRLNDDGYQIDAHIYWPHRQTPPEFKPPPYPEG